MVRLRATLSTHPDRSPLWSTHRAELAVATAHEAFDNDHALLDAELAAALGTIVDGLIDLARQRSQPARQAA